MDDEQFYELVRQLMYPARAISMWARGDSRAERKAARKALVARIEREIMLRQNAAAIRQDEQRLAVKGP